MLLGSLFMKILCKKVWILGLLCILWTSFFTSCSETVEASGERTLFPAVNQSIDFKLYPNDMAKNDSAAAHLARGVMLMVHPEAAYTLSFDIDPTQPTPELQLFRTYEVNGREGYVNFTKVRTLMPTVVGNRYVYSFTCHENKMSIWATTLGVDGKYYEGKVENVRLNGVGTNSTHFSINLIVVGAMEKTKDGLSIEEFSSYLLSAFREKYYGVTIDTLYVRYANTHPTLGYKYPAEIPWVAGESSEDMFVSELAGWPEDNLRNALNIIMVHSISKNEIMGFAHLFSGVLGSGNESSVVIGEHVRKTGGGLELLSAYTIAMTAIHESGHFFGLRHTSTTRRDLSHETESGLMVLSGDLSNMEDGLTDTPFCIDVFRSTLYKTAGVGDAVYRSSIGCLAKSGIETCPDVNNIMFPITVSDTIDVIFTEQQMEIIRSSLMIFPH